MPIYNNGTQISELKPAIKIVLSSSEEYKLNSANSIQVTRDQKLYKQNSDNYKRSVLDKNSSAGFRSSQISAPVTSPLKRQLASEAEDFIYAYKAQKLHKDSQKPQQKQVSTENFTTESNPVRNLTSNILSPLKRQFAMEAEDCIQISKTQKLHDIHFSDLERNLLISDILHILPQPCYSDSEDQKDDDDDESEKDDDYFTLPSDFYDDEESTDKFSYDQENFSKIEYPDNKKCSVRFCIDNNTIREFPPKSLPNLDRYKGERACPPPKPAIKSYIPYEFLTARMRTNKEKILEIVTLNNTEKNSIVKNPKAY